MKAFISACGIVLLLLVIVMQSASAQGIDQDRKLAAELFKSGKFQEAEKLFKKIVKENPKGFLAMLRLGRIALFSNRLEEARDWLKEVIKLRPEGERAIGILAEVFYRQDEFQEAAKLYREVDREVKAKKLESFKGIQSYQVQGEGEATRIKFVMADPLPVLKVRVNNSEEVNFIIDTGGGELIIDSEFAQEVGAHQFGAVTSVFAGGMKSSVQHGRIDSLFLGDFRVKNVPVNIQEVRKMSSIFRGKRVDGIIGTIFLYHFLASIDYPSGELILRRKTKENLERFEREAQIEDYIIVPFWMAGDHYMVAWGTVNRSQPMLFFVDTGLAANGFMCPESTLKIAGIELKRDLAREGIGGGKGKVKAIPFAVSELTLGGAKEQKIPGVYIDPFPLGDSLGFHIGGLISHAFFRNYTLTFDFSGMRFFLKRKKH